MRSRRDAGLAGGLIAIGLGLAVIALLGPLATGVIEYHVTETLRNQTIGLDAVSLLVVSPLSFLAAVLILRRHIAGAALGLGIGAYTTYMAVQYILGPEYERLPGNNELLFPLYLVLFALGWLVALAAWTAFDSEQLPETRRRDRLVGRVVLPLVAIVVFLRYIPALVDWMSSSPEDSGYLAGPTFAWAIAMLDLGVFLPATIAACVGLVQGAPWARKALFTVIGWFGLVGLAVAAMAITMYLNDDPNASGANVVFMTALGLALVILALILYRPLFRKRENVAGSNGDQRWTRRTLVVLQLLIALNAVGGATYAFGGAPDVPLEWLDGTPFDSYLVPGLILLVTVGGGMTAAAVMLLSRHPRAPEASIAAGVVLVGWITVQVLIIVPDGGFSWLQPTMFIAGLVIIALSWQLSRVANSLEHRAVGRDERI